MHRYWIKLKQRFAIAKSLRWVVIGSIVFILSLFAARSVAQSPNKGTGLMFEGVRDLNNVSLTTVQYTGECSGQSSPEIQGWFTSATTPPARQRRVVIRNITAGLRPDKQPFTDRQYNEGTVSEPTVIEFGTEHSGRKFRVLPGENEFEYEIRERKTIVESGSFTALFANPTQTQERNSSFQTQQVCANSSVAVNVCADVRTRNKWACPDGAILRQELQPQGPVKTLISNQTLNPISYELSGRIHYLQPGQDKTFTGDNLGSIRFPNPYSDETSSQLITSGTRYRFVDSSNRLELSQWSVKN
jgi:hypothetical protein